VQGARERVKEEAPSPRHVQRRRQPEQSAPLVACRRSRIHWPWSRDHRASRAGLVIQPLDHRDDEGLDLSISGGSLANRNCRRASSGMTPSSPPHGLLGLALIHPSLKRELVEGGGVDSRQPQKVLRYTPSLPPTHDHEELLAIALWRRVAAGVDSPALSPPPSLNLELWIGI